jgi:hypothetical protein
MLLLLKNLDYANDLNYFAGSEQAGLQKDGFYSLLYLSS